MSSIEDYNKAIAEQAKLYAEGKAETYFKYFSDADEVINGIFKEQKLRFTQPRVLNDPLEFSPVMRFNDTQSRYTAFDLKGVRFPSVESFFRVQIIESQVNAYGILSLTKIPNSFDMWSHYANGHRGFVFEFKDRFWQHPCMKSQAGDEYPVRKVKYVEDYFINLDNLVNTNYEIPTAVLHRELFFKKTSRWKNEHEYRMVRPLSESPDYFGPKSNYPHEDIGKYLFPFDWDCISSVIMGANMSVENKQLIALQCEKNNKPLYLSLIIKDLKDSFGRPCTIYIIPLNVPEYKEIMLSAQPQLCCTDTTRLSNQGTIEIFNINELPYYGDYKEQVDELYKNMTSDHSEKR